MRNFLVIVGLLVILGVIVVGYIFYQNYPTRLDISVSSQSSGKTVEFLNKDKLLSEMNALGFGKKNGVGLRQGTDVIWTTVSKVNIILVSLPQPWPLTYSGQRQVARSSFDIKAAGPGAVNLYLWVEPRTTESVEDRQKFYNRELLSALYTATHWNNDGKVSSPYFSYLRNLDNTMLSSPADYPISVVE